MTTISDKKKEIQTILTKYVHMFEDFHTQIKISLPKQGANGDLFSFYLPKESEFYNLTDNFGKIQLKIIYRSQGRGSPEKILIEEFSYKFISNNVDVIVIDEAIEQAPSKYGFRIDRDTTVQDRSHPEIHLQHNYMRRPRIDMNMGSGTGRSNEMHVLSTFLRTLDINFFEDKDRCVEDASGIILKHLQLR